MAAAFDFLAFDFGAFDAGVAGPANNWRPTVRLAGVDVTGAVYGQITVDAEEDSARVAEFALALSPGAAVTLTAYTGATVEIDFSEDVPGAIPGRLFTGVVDLPRFDPGSRSVMFRCTDDLPGVVAALDFPTIDTLVGGQWSPVLFEETADGWQYARDRLSTVAASLDLTPTRAPRLTNWAAKATADLEYTAANVIDGGVVPELANRSDLRNRVDIAFSYRFPLLKRRAVTSSYDVMADVGGLFGDYLLAAHWMPTREAVREAAKSTGWTISSESWTETPPPGGYVTTSPPFIVSFGIDPSVRSLLCMGWTLGLSLHFGQTVDEAYSLRIENAESVAQMGALAESRSYTMAVEFDVAAWESSANNPDPTGATPVVPGPELNPASGEEARAEWAPDSATDRAAAEAAILAMVASARATILGSHRQTSVTLATPLDPRADLDKTIRVDCSGIIAKGKARAVSHVLDTETGEAVTKIEIAVASLAGLGFAHPDDPVAAPTPPATTTPVEASFTCVSDFEWHYAAVDHDVTITVPGVNASSRDPLVVPIPQTFAAGFVEDEFTITAE